jgi:dTDP-4-dehydrorhamnose reductase
MTPRTTPRAPLSLWGGIECTVNRVRDGYLDQVRMSGHDRRPDDLDRIAALGVRTLRYPVWWERVSPHRPDAFDWAWPDERLGRLRLLGVDPVVGLLHHGSGPAYTNLLDEHFAPGLARLAGRVAERYPWVGLYTPVNEPLTTARFSTLYGHWYPHLCDGLAFARAVLAQCRAVVLAMRAVRRVRPDALLVQTEDLGKTHSTEALRYQADFENERRWLTFDLLLGRVDRRHPVGAFFLWLGVPEEELLWFQDNPSPPDVVGLNHYLTSERFLDERLDRYPGVTPGGNGRHAYVDVEMVRVGALDGPEGLLGEAWERYRRPLAVTEAHLSCTREEQMRWLLEVWRAAGRVRDRGADVRAVTAWSLLGAYDWDSLVTVARGRYEPGAFDVRGGSPRPTALAGLIRDLAGGREPDHPCLAAPGWWRRPERLLYPPATSSGPRPAGRPLLVVGGGALAGAVAEACRVRGLPCRMMPGHDADAVTATLAEEAAWAVVGVDGAAGVAGACAGRGVRVLTFGGEALPGALVAPASPERVHAALDLLLDGERGVWEL